MLFEPLVPWKIKCGPGYGMATCLALNVLVTSDTSTNLLSVWDLKASFCTGPKLVCTLNGEFRFLDSGCLAFTKFFVGGTTQPLLLVSDAGNGALHVLDVVGRTRAGYIAGPGTEPDIGFVAASDTAPLVAIGRRLSPTVTLFRGTGAKWEQHRRIWLRSSSSTSGMRFTREGTVCVTSYEGHTVSWVSLAGAAFPRPPNLDEACSMQHIDCRYPMDVQEVGGKRLFLVATKFGVKSVCCGAKSVCWGGVYSRSSYFYSDVEFTCPCTTLAVEPELGLAIRSSDGHVYMCMFSDTAVLWTMSDTRVSWMVVVFRAAVRRNDC